MNVDIYTIVFFAIAVVIFVRLYRVLGTKTGAEKPPFVPDDHRDRVDDGSAGNDNVISLPRQVDAAPRREPADPATVDPLAVPGSSLAAALRTVVAADRNFEPTHFVTGAKAAYEMIVTAYAAGDRKTLKTLLSKEVMDSFGRGIDEREKKGEKVEFTFVGLDKADIVEAALVDGFARITVRFAAKVISLTRAADGTIVDGDAGRLSDLLDVWTFAREAASSDPNWRLVETRAVA
ncbi:Tim44/TimA family putative adaptor protein [Siculibacillus lacustris]|uniref:Tim44/TimA family putative adaptor protein n=1 Tax=Siculibacillus lacustris TaxID=1549641 RepID=A0A4Q9VK96_9HYPH|nr:Tim44/TimA family putative adaptor protein [Siculibacillus lacustris]TBW35793.1 Tim44/TimA family putative adaptor protein [Siculibacillus lacustris]